MRKLTLKIDSNPLSQYDHVLLWITDLPMKHFCNFSIFFLTAFACIAGNAAIVQINGKWSDARYAPTLSLSEHFDLGSQKMSDNNWGDALQNFMIIVLHFPESPYYSDSLFNSGLCYYYLSELDLADKQFSKYLNLPGQLKHFETVFEFKYNIAEAYAKGSKKHMMGFKQLPKWMPAKGDAIALYDEVIASLPGREIAVKALYGKATLLLKKRQYKESIEALQLLARRFPKHTLAADAYLLVSEIYLEQSVIEAQNPDLLALAQINLNRFQKAFPGDDERINQAQQHLLEMKEIFAKSLYDTGRFYEKKKKTHASRIYFNEAIKRYPETKAAGKSNDRLALLDKSDKSHQVAQASK